LAESYQSLQQGQQRVGGAAGKEDDDDDDVPDLVETFDVPDVAPAAETKSGDLEDLN
jgi:nascent polypeptide-associated complex subunit beta